jgi:uncharacterized protein YkwD
MDKLSLHAAVTALLALAGPGAEPCQASEAAVAGYAGRVMHAVNAYRLEKGLPALLPAPALLTLASEHSSEMAALKRPSHDGFAQRFERTGAALCVENVAHGFHVPEEVLFGWRSVVSHHRNLLEPRVRYLGMANTGLYVTFFACDTPD